MCEIVKNELTLEVRKFDRMIAGIRSAICGLETDGSDSEHEIAKFEPLLVQAKEFAKQLMLAAAGLLEYHIVVGVRDAIFDLEEQFEEIKHGCPLDA